MENKVLKLLEANSVTPGEKKTFLQHLACTKKLASDKVTRTWRDSDKVLCVEYVDGCWFHYTEKGEWY